MSTCDHHVALDRNRRRQDLRHGVGGRCAGQLLGGRAGLWTDVDDEVVDEVVEAQARQGLDAVNVAIGAPEIDPAVVGHRGIVAGVLVDFEGQAPPAPALLPIAAGSTEVVDQRAAIAKGGRASDQELGAVWRELPGLQVGMSRGLELSTQVHHRGLAIGEVHETDAVVAHHEAAPFVQAALGLRFVGDESSIR